MNHDHALSAPTAPTAPKPPHARSAGATATACAPATRDGSTRCAVRRGGLGVLARRIGHDLRADLRDDEQAWLDDELG